jgi:hypothetical protein
MIVAGVYWYKPNTSQNGERYEGTFTTWDCGVEICNALELVKDTGDDKARVVGHEQRPSLVNEMHGGFYFLGPQQSNFYSRD